MLPGLTDLALLERLIAFDTVSSKSNLAMAEFLADYLDRPGVHVTWNRNAAGTRTNLLVECGARRDDRAGLVLSGHMDVVPADEPDWTSDPFTLTRRGDDLYGRGTADMKGFLAVATNACAALERTPARPLALLFTFDEEVGTLGAHHFVATCDAAATLPRSVIVGEPTEFRAVRMHKGHLKLRVSFRGVPAHSGYPHLGRNAIEPAGRAIVALTELRRQLEREHGPNSEHFPEVPFVALNVAQVHGGVALNIVPDRCVVDVGIRVLPGMTGEQLTARVKELLAAELADSADYHVEVIADSPPMLLAADAPIHRELCQRLGQTCTHSVSFATDAGWFQTAGMDCIICGPGTIEVAHRPNEHVPLADLVRAQVLVRELIHSHCITQD